MKSTIESEDTETGGLAMLKAFANQSPELNRRANRPMREAANLLPKLAHVP